MTYTEMLKIYLQVWNERDAASRLSKLVGIVQANVVVFDPMGRLNGAVAIASFIGKVHTMLPFDRLEYTSEVQKHDHGNWVRYNWGIYVQGQTAPSHTGMDALEFAADGRIVQVVSFTGKLE